jgi:hypothetical protein
MRLSAILIGCVIVLGALGARAETSQRFMLHPSTQLAQSLCNQARAESCNDEQLTCMNNTHNSMTCCTNWKSCMATAGCEQSAVQCH